MHAGIFGQSFKGYICAAPRSIVMRVATWPHMTLPTVCPPLWGFNKILKPCAGYINPDIGAFAACVGLLLPLAPAPAAAASDAAGVVPASDQPIDASLPAFAAGAHLGSDPPTHDSGASAAQLPSPGSAGNFAASAGDSIKTSAAAAIAPQAVAGNSAGSMAGAMDALSIST